MKTRVKLLWGSLPLVWSVLSSSACGGPSVECRPEPWSGTCELRAVNTLREAEFPAPHVVLEVVYAAQPNPQHPGYTPGDTKVEVQVVANQAQGLRDHLSAHSPVACQIKLPPAGVCNPGELMVSVPDYQPTAVAASEPSADQGCADLEETTAQDQVRKNLVSETLGQNLSFAQGSASATPESTAVLQQVAQRLQSEPAIRCVAVVGQITSGESVGLAHERAQTARQQLIAAGVDPKRLLMVTVTEQVFGAGTGPKPADADQRRVSFRVLLRREAASQ